RAFHVTGVQTCALPISGTLLDHHLTHPHIGHPARLGASSLFAGIVQDSLITAFTAHFAAQTRRATPVVPLAHPRVEVILQVEQQIGRASCRETVWVWVG